MNYDQKTQEADVKCRENEALLDEMTKKTLALNELSNELDTIKDNTTVHKRRTQDMMLNILRDLSEVGTFVGGNVSAGMKVLNDILRLS